MNGEIIRLSVVDSTNIYTSKMLSQSGMNEWTTVVADHQTGGKGQRGRKWDSKIGDNILCSTLLKPTHLKSEQHFFISMVASIAAQSTLLQYGLQSKIKWPNDVLVSKKKLAGILIENQISKGYIESSIVGFGLNVNQLEFSSYPWEASSMINLLGVPFDLDKVLETYRRELKIAYELTFRPFDELYTRYSANLFGINNELTFSHGNTNVRGRLSGVDASGRLLLDINGSVKAFASGEIRLVRTSSE